jgi:hypothetical protein
MKVDPMAETAFQDAQIFKERCEDSPGVLVLCQGDWRPTPERIRLFEEQNYYVLTAANGYQDIVDWLPHQRCIGSMFAHPETVTWAQQNFPDKVITRFEGVGARFLRSLTQELPCNLHSAGIPFTATMPGPLKTLDVVASFSPAPLKRGQLLMEVLLASSCTAYLFAASLGGNPEVWASFEQEIRNAGKQIEFLHYPFDPYALLRVDGRIVIDCRPIGANNSIVSNYLARARLFLHTSTTEGISNAVMEALFQDVPVLLCDDIRGPLQNLSCQLPECITRSAPDAASLLRQVNTLLSTPRNPGAISQPFRAHLDPFAINREVVRKVQAWFAHHGHPWKGHCLGLLGGVQSKLDLNEVSAEESYRGRAHIYPNAAEAAHGAVFQAHIAHDCGHPEFSATLQAELFHIQQTVSPVQHSAVADNRLETTNTFHQWLAHVGRTAPLHHALFIGGNAEPHWIQLLEQFPHNDHTPRLDCLNLSSKDSATLQRTLRAIPDLHFHIASTVPPNAFCAAQEVADFHHTPGNLLQQYPLESVLGWLQQGLATAASLEDQDGIQTVRAFAGIEHFDLAIIDGSEFTGFAEVQQVIGASLIFLGCTRTFKNARSLQWLRQHPDYESLFELPDLGNGVAGFIRSSNREQYGIPVLT